MKKRVITVILTVVLILSLVPAALAADSTASSSADALYNAGLFRGVGTNPNGTPNYDLDRTMNRYEGMTMLVRLLGAEEAANSGHYWYLPFDDVVDWAKPYVSYAYLNSLTKGVSETRFGGAASIKTSEYLTFVCRALGYSDSIDFAWDSAWTLTDRIGVTHGEYRTNSAFSRSDAVKVSLAALRAKMKNSDLTLIEYLYVNDAVSEKAVCDILGLSSVNSWVKEQKTIYNESVKKRLVFIDDIVLIKDFSQKEFTDKEAVFLLPDSSEKWIFSIGEDIELVASISDVEKSVKKLFGKTVDVRSIKSDAIKIIGENVILYGRSGVGVMEVKLQSVTKLGNNDYAIVFCFKNGNSPAEKYLITVNYDNGNVVYKGFEYADLKWKLAYKSVISDYYYDFVNKYGYSIDPPGDYCVYDIDKNGVPELFVKHGSSEADFRYCVYSYDEALNKCFVVTEFSGSHSSICALDREPAFIIHGGHMGYESIKKITYHNYSISTQTIRNDETVSGYTPFEYIKTYNLYDEFGILNWNGNAKTKNDAILAGITD